MKIVEAPEYAPGVALAFVRALLVQTNELYGCGPSWNRQDKTPLGEQRVTLEDEALSAETWHPYILADAAGDAVLGESSWMLSSNYPAQQYGPGGYVTLIANVSARLYLNHGTPNPMSEDGTVPGFLCRGDEHVLVDGTSCYSLRTTAGLLWLRPVSRGKSLFTLFARQDPPKAGLGKILHLAETSCDLRELRRFANDPWTGFTTRDRSGRAWEIRDSRLDFSATLGLRALGRYNDRLLARSAIRLEPPYEAIWQPGEQSDFGVPLELRV